MEDKKIKENAEIFAEITVATIHYFVINPLGILWILSVFLGAQTQTNLNSWLGASCLGIFVEFLVIKRTK